MAIRTKTIEYALTSSVATVSAGGVRNFTPLTVYIPETGSRSFRSCFIEYSVDDAQAAVGSPTSWQFQYRVGSGTPVSQSTTRTFTNTGEHQNYVFVHDVTPAFQSGFGATTLSQSFQLNGIIAVVASNNASARLFITYDWDDAAQQRIKTVTIPMNGLTGSVVATDQGTFLDTIPALDTYLPETGKIYRNISIEWIGNDFSTTTSTTDPSASFALDNETHGSVGNVTGIRYLDLVSARSMIFNWLPSFNTSTTHSVWLRTQLTNMPFTCLAPRLVVTYEYNHAASTKVMNCIATTAADDNGMMGGNTAQFRSRFSRELTIQEPQVTMSRCGIYHSTVDAGAVAFRPSVTEAQFTQSLVTFTFPAVVTCGGWACAARFDGTGGALGGQGMELTHGNNKFTLDWYRTGTAAGTLGSNYSALAYFNYESAISSQPGGDANHAHLIKQFYAPILASNLARNQRTSSLSFAETSSYWLTSMGMVFYFYSSIAGSAVALQAMATGSDGESYGNFGWEPTYGGLQIQDAEIGPMRCYARMRDKFRRYPDEPDKSRLDATRNRPYTIDITTTNYPSCGYFFYTYHTIEYSLTGSITGSVGDGSGIPIKFFRADNNELVAETTTNVGGSFQKTWYDNTRYLYATAREDDNRVGRSANTTASGNP